MKRTRMTVETHRVLVMRQTRGAAAWCEMCKQRVRMVGVDEAATVARVSSRTIYRWVEAGDVHFAETPGGMLLVCARSLSARNIESAGGAL